MTKAKRIKETKSNINTSIELYNNYIYSYYKLNLLVNTLLVDILSKVDKSKFNKNILNASNRIIKDIYNIKKDDNYFNNYRLYYYPTLLEYNTIEYKHRLASYLYASTYIRNKYPLYIEYYINRDILDIPYSGIISIISNIVSKDIIYTLGDILEYNPNRISITLSNVLDKYNLSSTSKDRFKEILIYSNRVYDFIVNSKVFNEYIVDTKLKEHFRWLKDNLIPKKEGK